MSIAAAVNSAKQRIKRLGIGVAPGANYYRASIEVEIGKQEAKVYAVKGIRRELLETLMLARYYSPELRACFNSLDEVKARYIMRARKLFRDEIRPVKPLIEAPKFRCPNRTCKKFLIFGTELGSALFYRCAACPQKFIRRDDKWERY